MIRTAPEGRWFIVGAWVDRAGAAGWPRRVRGTPGWWIAAALWTLLAVWVVAFFRDPERPGPAGDRLIVAPADGKVVSIVEVEEPAFLRGPRAADLDLHERVRLSREPVSDSTARSRTGTTTPASSVMPARRKSSLDNEQSSVGLDTPRGKVLVRQIAGLVARRIVTDHEVGTRVHQGERMGMIRFGSRVDLFLPPGTRVAGPGRATTTRVGVTVVAEWS